MKQKITILFPSEILAQFHPTSEKNRKQNAVYCQIDDNESKRLEEKRFDECNGQKKSIGSYALA